MQSIAGRADVAVVLPPTPAELIARLVRIGEDQARLAADAVALVHAPQPAPVVVHVEATGRTAWTVAEFATSLGLAKNTVYRLIKRGEIRHGRINGDIRISEAERLRWWAEAEQRTATELGLAEP